MLAGRFQRPWFLAPLALLLYLAVSGLFNISILVAFYVAVLLVIIGTPLAIIVRLTEKAGQPHVSSIRDVLALFSLALLHLALYNLIQFHWLADGSIVTRGLFGVDIPFLAGEVHGIRLFGTLRDLHQFGTPWQYHDALYRLLALFPREETLPDLAFTAPLVGYTLLGFSVLALARRLTENSTAAWATVAAWFLVSGFAGLDQSSYALSPSFVFGSLIFVCILLLLDARSEDMSGPRRVVFDLAIAALLLLLAETKLTTFVVLAAGLGVLSILALFRKRCRWAVEMVTILAVPTILLALQSKPNPLMPAGDFLVGAPLLGYGNHLATLLHMPTEALDPVSHGLSFTWRSLLIVPFFLLHFIRFTIGDPRILAAIISLIFVSGRIKSDVHRLCVVLVPVGFLMPVIYSPAWYPLALSFYAPLVSTQAAILITVPFAFGMVRGTGQPRRMIPAAAIGMLLLLGFLANGWSVVMQDRAPKDIVGADFIRAVRSIANESDSGVVVTRRFDYEQPGDESYFWYAALSTHPVVSEGAKYGSLLAAVADTDSAKGLHRVTEAERLLHVRRALLDTIYQCADSARVAEVLRTLHVGYLVEDRTDHGSHGTNESHFPVADLVFSDSACTIWRIRP
ncbi:MAG: hypothetical protein Q8922_10200 [Bacteroidota bacterium]|nr:hypothetical protein [Bacteroidota bacterium]